MSTGCIVAHEYLPEQLIEPCLDVLKRSTTGEREMIRVIVEVVAEMRDNTLENEVSNLDPDTEVSPRMTTLQSQFWLMS